MSRSHDDHDESPCPSPPPVLDRFRHPHLLLSVGTRVGQLLFTQHAKHAPVSRFGRFARKGDGPDEASLKAELPALFATITDRPQLERSGLTFGGRRFMLVAPVSLDDEVANRIVHAQLLAFSMGTHARLGEASPVRALPQEIKEKVGLHMVGATREARARALHAVEANNLFTAVVGASGRHFVVVVRVMDLLVVATFDMMDGLAAQEAVGELVPVLRQLPFSMLTV